jgi:hypothetical protein
MSTPSTIFTEMVTSTDRTWGQGVTDNVSKHNALLMRMKKRGKIKTVGGGYEIVERVEYAENATYQRYAGYDALNTGASDVLTSAVYPFRQVALHVVASGREIRMNSSKEAMINLVEERKANAIRTAANQFSIDLYSSGALSEQINGLQNIIQTNGEGTVGGINSTAWPFWRNKFREATGTNPATTLTVAAAATFKGDMNNLWLATTRGTDAPDLIVFSHDFFSLYEIGEQDKQRYADAELAQAGFTTLKYKSADVIFDDNSNFATNSETGYFLNTDYLKLVQHREAAWTPDAEKKPTNQDAVVVPIYWMGNLVCSNRALQGRLIDAS